MSEQDNEGQLTGKAGEFLKGRITRRQAIKVGGLAAAGLVFSKPLIETIRPESAFARYEGPGDPPDPLEPLSALTLLGTLSVNNGGSTIGVPGTVPSHVGLGLVPKLQHSHQNAPIIGGDFVVTNRQNRVVEFNTFNSPGFDDLVSKLTNGVDEVLGTQTFLAFIQSDGSFNLFSATGTGRDESAIFGTSSDLVGRSIAVIRFIMTRMGVSIRQNATNWSIHANSLESWEFWGT